ncbi:MAG: ATP-binding protein [Yoonia sp.]|uniref:ATP-binding protein n=1 Tax=Yoonia sp. TaxID=2212373 RepID=UPI003EF425AC
MISFTGLIFVALGYVTLLFTVAFWADRRAAIGQATFLQSRWIYTLSISIYCTAWTFYGAVGYAARSGLEFVTIYLGPSLVMIGWWWVLRRLVRIGRAQRITSIADLVSSRFGKSTQLGVIVTVISVVAGMPYIALQLQSVTLSIAVFAQAEGALWEAADYSRTALWIALGLAIFTILFGTRNLDANERHDGIVMAIALEAVVKLFALVAVGVFVVWGVAGGPMQMLDKIDQSDIVLWDVQSSRWISLIFLSAAAFMCLPRMFQVLVVENVDERHLHLASWAFPLYLFLMSLFVVPIAVVGLELLPEGSNPDLFVLTVPLSQGQNGLAVLSFLGGLSSATSMVIVATIALATMVSNHIVVPWWLYVQGEQRAVISGDVRKVILRARRISIAAILVLGFIYYRTSGGGTALAAIGLISFTGVVQILPAMLGGIFWRAATRVGAAAGLLTGLTVWLWTLFLPSFGVDAFISETVMQAGPFGQAWLRPQALFWITDMDPLVHGIMWSMILNAMMFVVFSLLTFPTPLERLQGAQFVNVFDHTDAAPAWTSATAGAEDLLIMSQRIIGSSKAQAIFEKEARQQGKDGYLPEVTSAFIEGLERELAGSVGAATAHAMIGQLIGGSSVSVQDLIAVADEAAQILEYSSQLEAKSAEQERTARALRDANAKLTALSIQKDAFLSQISHELRTPMTSIRSFSDILREGDMPEDALRRYAGIIHDEAIRLTRLLDDLLDLSVLENGQVVLHEQTGDLSTLLDRAERAAGLHDGVLQVRRNKAEEDAITLTTDLDRLGQVFINLISNARKYCYAENPTLDINAHQQGDRVYLDFIDNGQGISPENRELIFEKFSRVTDEGKAGGAGLGLAICREIMLRLGGEVNYLPLTRGTGFRVTLPPAKTVGVLEKT